MKWSEKAWNEIVPTFESILSLPFIQELKAGSLAREKFNFYMQQDSIYLASYVQVLSHIASRLPIEVYRIKLLEFAVDGVAVEKAIHQDFLSGINGTAIPSPTCQLYTSFLKAQAYEEVEVEMASVLPCFWVYQRVGETILTAVKDLASNPYEKWIETYADQRFAESTRQAIEICDRLAECASPATRSAMTEVFKMATKMEFLFWQSAYNMEQWTI